MRALLRHPSLRGGVPIGRARMVESDSLYRKVAKRVLTTSLAVESGESVTVETWNNGLDFARTVVAEARSMGCTAMLVLEDEDAYVEGLGRSPGDRVGRMGKNEYGMLSGSDAYVFVPGPLLAAYQTRVKPSLMSESTRYNGSWYEAAEKAGLRGARLTFGYIGEELAGILGKTVEEIVRRQLEAALVDSDVISKSAKKLVSTISAGGEVRLSAGASRLGLRLKGQPEVEDGIVSKKDVKAGENMTYMPPGFVTCGVEQGSVTGTLKVARSLTRLGLLEDAALTFREGKLTQWKSTKSKKMLDELVKGVPEEKRSLSILMVGLNPKMGYVYGQDRMVAGSVTVAGFGFTGVVRDADLSVGGRMAVTRGRI